MKIVISRFAAITLSVIALAACTDYDDDAMGSDSIAVIGHSSPYRIDKQYIVVFKKAASGAASPALGRVTNRLATARDGSALLFQYPNLGGLAAKLSDAQLALLVRDPDVAYIEADQLGSVDAIYGAPAGTGIDRVDQRQRPIDGLYSDFGNAGQGVHVYIIDTGIYKQHSEFTGRVGAGKDFYDNDNDPADCHGHGTHVASTAAGTQYGIAKRATLHALRAIDCFGFGPVTAAIAAVEFVTDECGHPSNSTIISNSPRCVVNMSLRYPASTALDTAVNNAVAAGVGMSVAAGNENSNACNASPARATDALTVGAVDSNDRRASFSNFGTCVDLFAPGVGILGAGIDNPTDTAVMSGTSMATPHVTGVLAEYFGAHPGATAEEAEDALVETAGQNCVADEKGSPDLLLHNNFEADPFDCEHPPAPPDSCVGYCGGLSIYGCYCDAECDAAGDCCPDKHQVCD